MSRALAELALILSTELRTALIAHAVGYLRGVKYRFVIDMVSLKA
jgi:hypothetical protein